MIGKPSGYWVSIFAYTSSDTTFTGHEQATISLMSLNFNIGFNVYEKTELQFCQNAFPWGP